MKEEEDSDFCAKFQDRAYLELKGTELMQEVDITRPPKLYRYAEKGWLERSLRLGEFRLRPASHYKKHESDIARHDDELVRVRSSPASAVTVTIANTDKQIKPIGEVTYRSEVGTDYFALCFSKEWDEKLFDDFPETDACLVILDVETFCERIHTAADAVLPGWGGLDAPVVYGSSNRLGAAFSKPLRFIPQHEWRFVWRPISPIAALEPMAIRIGSIEQFAKIIERPPGKE